MWKQLMWEDQQIYESVNKCINIKMIDNYIYTQNVASYELNVNKCYHAGYMITSETCLDHLGLKCWVCTSRTYPFS